MADNVSGSEFGATITSLGADQYSATLPAYVLDKTVRDLMKALTTAVSESSKENTEGLKNLAKEYQKALGEATDDTNEEIKAQTKVQEETNNKLDQLRQDQNKSRNQEQIDEAEYNKKIARGIQAGAEKGGRLAGDIFVSALKGVAVILGTASGVVLNSFNNLGQSLKSLTDTGQAFGDNLSVGTMSTTDNIIALNRMGLTTEEAVSTLMEYSRAMSTMGQSSLINVTKEFLALTNRGVELGITLDEATELFMQDQQFRARTLNMDRIEQTLTAQLTRQSIVNLRGFSQILGQSTDAIRQSAEGVMDGNKAFLAFTNSLNPAQATTMNQVAKDLVSGLIAVFPESGEELGNALLSVAGTGVTAISEFANLLIPLGGDISREFQSLARGLREGTIAQQDVPSAIAGIVEAADMNQEQLEQLSVIAALQGHPMQSVAETIITMQQEASVANTRLKRLISGTDLRFDQIQTATASFENILRQMRGGYSSLLNAIPVGATLELGNNLQNLMNVFDDSGGVSFFTQELERAGKSIGRVIGEVLNDLGGEEGFKAAISSIMTGLIELTANILERVSRIIKAFEKDGKVDFFGVIKQFIAEGIAFFFEALGEALKMVPWGDVLPLAGIYLAFVATASLIGAAFGAAATMAGLAFQAAAAKVALSGSASMMGAFGKVGRMLLGGAGLLMGGAAIYQTATMPRDTEYERKKSNRSIAGMIIGGVLAAGITFLSGGTAIPILLAAGGAGMYGGSKLGGMTAGEDPNKNANRMDGQITSPSLQGPITPALATNYIDSLTDPDSAQGITMTTAEINKLDTQTAEAKTLALVLAEMKLLNRKIQHMKDAGLLVKEQA